MKKIALLLCCAMLLTLFGCGVNTPETTQAPTTTTAPAEALELRYDDRILLSDICDEKKPEVTISDQNVTSKAVGTDDPDEAVLTYDEKGKCIVATGTGTATVQVADKVYDVTVTAAPISLFMITGHSIGAGQCGDPQISAVCADGMAYSSHGTNALQGISGKAGIGYGSKIAGIDAFSAKGEGTIGEGSGLAWQWIEETGEKVWVLNTAVPGACLPEWIPGEEYYENAVTTFKAAEAVLASEVAAGHYELKDMAVLYHGGTNFVNPGNGNNYTYSQEDLKNWYDAMWNGFKTEFTMDIGGTSRTVSKIGFVPIYTSTYQGGFFCDIPANYYMSASSEYSEYFIASDIGRLWLGNDDVKAHFPAPGYDTHMGTPQQLTSSDQIFSDGVHYTQLAYNALGTDIAKQLYTALRGEFAFNGITLQDDAGNPINDTYTLAKGQSVSIVPQVDSVGAGGMDFTVSGSISKSFPCVITGTASGSGTLQIKRDGAVIKTVTFTVQ